MGPGLQLTQRLTQSLILAPQLQQSLALLQAPTLELKALVEQELQQNPVLEEMDAPEMNTREVADEDGEDRLPEPTDLAEPPEDVQFDSAADKAAADPVDDFQAEFDRLVQLDQDWRDHFAQTNTVIRASADDEEKREFMLNSITAETSLAQHLMEQVRDTELNAEEQGIAELLIGNIDDYGYLMASIEELAVSTNVPGEHILKVLQVIQGFDPAGIGARDLRECLLLQLERLGRQDTLEYRIIRDQMDALGKRRIPEIARGTGQPV